MIGLIRRFFGERQHSIPIIVASDTQFLPHLAVMLKSIENTLESGYIVEVYAFHNGINPRNRKGFESIFNSRVVRINWTMLSGEVLRQFNVRGHVNEMTYYRVLAPAALPETVDKAIYIDADIVLNESLHKLWELGMDGAELRAAQDVTVPYMDASKAMANYSDASDYLSKMVPLKYYEELAIPSEAPYFNAGVLMIDVERWKAQSMTEKLIEHMVEFRAKNTFWDQDALNALFWDRWAKIPPEWNQTAHIFRFPKWECSPLEEREFLTVRDRPKLIHFSTRSKPWHDDCNHPLKEKYEYFQNLIKYEFEE